MKNSTLLLVASLSLPFALAACNRDDDCSLAQKLLGNCTTNSGTSGGTGGGSTAGTSGGTGGGSTAGTSGGTGGGSTAGTSGGTGGGSTAGTSGGTGGNNFGQDATTSSPATSSVKICSTYCNSNDAGCYNISKCETEKYSTSSKSTRKNKN